MLCPIKLQTCIIKRQNMSIQRRNSWVYWTVQDVLTSAPQKALRWSAWLVSGPCQLVFFRCSGKYPNVGVSYKNLWTENCNQDEIVDLFWPRFSDKFDWMSLRTLQLWPKTLGGVRALLSEVCLPVSQYKLNKRKRKNRRDGKNQEVTLVIMKGYKKHLCVQLVLIVSIFVA